MGARAVKRDGESVPIPIGFDRVVERTVILARREDWSRMNETDFLVEVECVAAVR